MVNIRLPDGSSRPFPGPVTVAEIAQSIGAGLARAALAGRVDGKLVDTSYRVDRDAEVAIVTDKDTDGLEVIRHSTAHLLAYAVKELFPDAQVTIGPVIEDGFYYDFSFKRPFTPEDLAAIEKKMAELAKKDDPVAREAWPRDEAVEFFRSIGEHYKAEIIASIPADEPISLYREGGFIDLCRGPHVPSTGKLKVFKLMKVAGAYWRGDSKNEMLQRIYGTAWAKKEDLDAYLHCIEEAEKRDHRRLGTPARSLPHCRTRRRAWSSGIRRAGRSGRQVEQYMRRVYRDNGYQEVRAPQILDRSAVGEVRALGELQGEHVHDGVGEARLRDQADELPGPRPDLQLGPAQLPRPAAALRRVRHVPPQRAFGRAARHHAGARLHAGRRPHLLHRGPDPAASASRSPRSLHGLPRLRLHRRRSIKIALRPPKRVGADATWDKAEARAASRRCSAAGVRVGPSCPAKARSTGPRSSTHLKDSIGRVWQCGTMQVDFQMPERLGRRVRRRGQHAEGPGDAAPGDRRLAGALHRHPDRALCRCVAALARAGPGGRPEHHRPPGRATRRRSRTT